MGQQLMAIVGESERGRVYASPNHHHQESANISSDPSIASTSLPEKALGFRVQAYGMVRHRDLFTERQLVALSTFSDLVGEVRGQVLGDARAAGLPNDGQRLANEGNGADAYSDAVATYLAFGVDRLADRGSTISGWDSSRDSIRNTFGRQTLQMTWDFSEANPLGDVTGSFVSGVSTLSQVIAELPATADGYASQADAASRSNQSSTGVVSTDPPYYDNIGYADLSDFFYVWLRRSLGAIWTDLFSTLLVPKSEELVATPYRFKGGKQEAESFFEDGLRRVFVQMARYQTESFPTTVFYAFKQAETEARGTLDASTASTGWETMLEGLLLSGYQVTGTWPMRTEMANRNVASGTNALASSIVLACRVRRDSAPETTRQQFMREMRTKLAEDLRPLQNANIAPVDLAQAAIGPGMAIYSRYSRVREASGDSLKVREALGLINQVLDEVLAEQDEEYDPATRWAITWYEQYGMNDGPFGDAEGLAKARVVAVSDLANDGMLKSGRGKVRFTWREELPEITASWQPRSIDVADWVIMQRLAHAVQTGQQNAAEIKARIDAVLPGRTELARDLAYRAYNIAERKGWTREALVYNTLVQNWSDLEHLAAERDDTDTQQQLGLQM